MTSPYAFYQYWLNVEDASVAHAAARSSPTARRDEIAELERQVASEPFRRAAQRTLAADVTTLVHGAAATAAVQAASEALFGKGDLRGAGRAHPAPTPRPSCPGQRCTSGCSVVDALVAVGLVESRNAARRAIGDGGASVNDAKVTDPERVLAADDVLHEPGGRAPARAQVAGRRAPRRTPAERATARLRVASDETRCATAGFVAPGCTTRRRGQPICVLRRNVI